MTSTPDVIVIGAGFAGLSCATALAEAGARVLVLEARPVLGGRAYSFRDARTGEWVDNGQHALVGSYLETFRFLRRIGTYDRVRIEPLTLPMIDSTGRPRVFAAPPLPPPWNLVSAILALTPPTFGGVASVVRAGAAVRRLLRHRTADAVDGVETVAEWLRRSRQSARACELIWEPLTLTALNQSSAEAAAIHLVGVLDRLCQPEANASLMAIPAAAFSDLYVEPAREYIERRGGVVWANAKARVVVEGQRVSHVEAPQRQLRAPCVISTVPWFSFADSIVGSTEAIDTILANAAAMSSSPIVTVNLWLDREVMTGPILGLPGRAFQWIFDRRRIVGAASHLSVISSGATALVAQSNDHLIAQALRDVREALPAARGAVVSHAVAVRERYATFSLGVGQPRRPAMQTPIHGLLLAGDWIATGLPATVEGAVISGHRAAEAALRPEPY